MITYKCKNCGAQLKVSDAGGFTCPFCGSRAFMSDSELRGNDEFRKKILSFYMAKAIEKENDYSGDDLWEENGKATFTMDNGGPLSIAYMDKYSYPGMDCYLARKNIVYIFEKNEDADLFIKGLLSLTFPEADMKLDRCFPILTQRVRIAGGKEALIFVRKPYFYPVEILAPLAPEHLAWVISRMENICCALEYSGISHGDLSPSSIFVNPVTHEGMLFGDYRNVRNTRPDKDLMQLRQTAVKIMEKGTEPAELTSFLDSKPRKDAYEDFEYWDNVIEKGFGGHRFVQF
jgi:DNA-directed RNA polymerase subunit RPC12/RpoP